MTREFLVRKALLALALIPLLTGIFVGVATFSFALPNEPIMKNLQERPDLLVARRANNGRVIDADTECIGMSVGLYVSPEHEGDGALKRAMRAESLFGCNQLLPWLESAGAGAHRDYFRYWHGYAAISRPVLSVLPYNDLRGYLFTISLLLLAVLAWRIGVDFGARAGAATAIVFVVLNAMGFWVVATKAATWFLVVGGALFFSRRDDPAAPLLAFFTLGSLTAFFDFLTTPALIFAMAAFVHCLYLARAGRLNQPWLRLISAGGFWGAGYAGLWAAKFMIAATLIDAAVWRDAFEAAAFRLRGASEHVETFFPGAAIYENVAALKTFWGPVAILLFIVIPLLKADARTRWADLWKRGRVFIAIAAIPIVWLEALSNHSQIHAAFTHLNFAVAALLSMFVFVGASVTGTGSATLHAAH